MLKTWILWSSRVFVPAALFMLVYSVGIARWTPWKVPEPLLVVTVWLMILSLPGAATGAFRKGRGVARSS